MAWYYCDNHAKPPIFTNPFEAPQCSMCRGPTTLCNNVVRFDKPGDYRLVWQDVGDKVVFRMEAGRYHAVLSDDVMPYDTTGFAPTMDLKPPGGGQWFSAIGGRGGGFAYKQEGGLISNGLSRVKIKLGHNDVGSAYGLAHILRRHPQLFHTVSASPAKAPATFDLSKFRDNMRSITAPYGPGTGARWVGIQLNNRRYVIHGIANLQHVMLIVDQSYNLITGFPGTNMGGLGQMPSTIREWPGNKR